MPNGFYDIPFGPFTEAPFYETYEATLSDEQRALATEICKRVAQLATMYGKLQDRNLYRNDWIAVKIREGKEPPPANPYPEEELLTPQEIEARFKEVIEPVTKDDELKVLVSVILFLCSLPPEANKTIIGWMVDYLPESAFADFSEMGWAAFTTNVTEGQFQVLVNRQNELGRWFFQRYAEAVPGSSVTFGLSVAYLVATADTLGERWMLYRKAQEIMGRGRYLPYRGNFKVMDSILRTLVDEARIELAVGSEVPESFVVEFLDNLSENPST